VRDYDTIENVIGENELLNVCGSNKGGKGENGPFLRSYF
jgi:hypothetical protein